MSSKSDKRKSSAQLREEELKVYFEDDEYRIITVTGDTVMEEIWEAVGDDLGLTVESAQNFFIWGVQDDLSVLLYAGQTVSQVREEWPLWLEQWSNEHKKRTVVGKGKKTLSRALSSSRAFSFSDMSMKTAEATSSFRFVFKKTCIVPLSQERGLRNETAVYLLFAEGMKSVWKSHYPCDLETAINLAGLAMQAQYGDFDASKDAKLFQNNGVLNVIPKHLQSTKKTEEWEDLIQISHQKMKGKSKVTAQMLYLQLIRQWIYYGCTFFRAKYVPSSEAFFSQHFSGAMVIGINSRGIHLIDPIVLKVISVDYEHIEQPKSDPKYFSFHQKKENGQHDHFHFRTNQANIINDLIHDWFAEFKREKIKIEKIRRIQSSGSSGSSGSFYEAPKSDPKKPSSRAPTLKREESSNDIDYSTMGQSSRDLTADIPSYNTYRQSAQISPNEAEMQDNPSHRITINHSLQSDDDGFVNMSNQLSEMELPSPPSSPYNRRNTNF